MTQPQYQCYGFVYLAYSSKPQYQGPVVLLVNRSRYTWRGLPFGTALALLNAHDEPAIDIVKCYRRRGRVLVMKKKVKVSTVT